MKQEILMTEKKKIYDNQCLENIKACGELYGGCPLCAALELSIMAIAIDPPNEVPTNNHLSLSYFDQRQTD
ncbi:hypothetical protein [Synechocystis salina]|uniref:hypothetical protein n=1 Tax=Synechocystis salina TaxID=945780 RepID=UPI001D133C87|nr:hypothetical protein [Synechocystis salina]